MVLIGGPFGLLGFGTATMLLNLVHVGEFGLGTMNIAMGFALGCMMQFYGAILSYLRGEFFSCFVFSAYSFFWLSFGMTLMLPHSVIGLPDHTALGWYLCVWGIFTGVMLIAVWKPKSNWAVRVIFSTLTVLFFLLALSEFLAQKPSYSDSSNTVDTIAGAVGLVCGFSAFYTAMAETLNSHYGCTILPIGVVEVSEPSSKAPPQMIAGPFGLLGFGTATVLLNLTHVGEFPLNTMNLGMGFALGCMMQFFGAIIAYTRGEMASAFAFAAYAFFWMSFGMTLLLPNTLTTGILPLPDHTALGWYLCVWGIFTFIMFFVVFKPKSSWAVRVIFSSLTVLFFLLAISEWTAQDPKYTDASNKWDTAAGAIGLLCGCAAFYTALAETVNNCWGQTILPIGVIEAPEPVILNSSDPIPPKVVPQLIAGPFGLLGFGTATMLLNLTHVGEFPLNTMNIAMGFALGCCMQFFGAIVATIKGQLVSAFAFAAYAFFWLSFGMTLMLPHDVVGLPNHTALGWYLCVWGIYTFIMLIAVWKPKSSWAVRTIFATLVILFFLLAISEWVGQDPKYADASNKWDTAAGAIGLICGFSAFYTGMAEVVNNQYGCTILPLGEIEAPNETVTVTPSVSVPISAPRNRVLSSS
jgi:uncharacterized protein